VYIQIQDLANELDINIDRVLRTVSNKRISLYFGLDMTKTISGVSQGKFLEYEKISIELSSLLAIYYLAGESEHHEKQYMEQMHIEGESYPCTYPLEVVFLDGDGSLIVKNNNCVENKKTISGLKDENNNEPIPVFRKGLTESIKLNRTIDIRNISNLLYKYRAINAWQCINDDNKLNKYAANCYLDELTSVCKSEGIRLDKGLNGLLDVLENEKRDGYFSSLRETALSELKDYKERKWMSETQAGISQETLKVSIENEEPIPEKGKKGSLVNWVKWKVENEGRDEAGNIRYGYQSILINEVDKYNYGDSSLKKAWRDAGYSKKHLK
jgi:hypothetical protein